MSHFAAKSIDFRGALCQTTNQNSKPDVLGLLTESGISLYSPQVLARIRTTGCLDFPDPSTATDYQQTYQEE
jgi:hypothetical protein